MKRRSSYIPNMMIVLGFLLIYIFAVHFLILTDKVEVEPVGETKTKNFDSKITTNTPPPISTTSTNPPQTVPAPPVQDTLAPVEPVTLSYCRQLAAVIRSSGGIDCKSGTAACSGRKGMTYPSTRRVCVSSSLSNTTIKTVMYHEVAHSWQMYRAEKDPSRFTSAYQKSTGDKNLPVKFSSPKTTSYLESQADCVALKVTGRTSAYGCNPKYRDDNYVFILAAMGIK